MRWVRVLSGCVAALITAGCDPASDRYFREGAGSDLNSGQLARATLLQDEYVYYICRQAGNSSLDPVGSSCVVGDWTAFTLAGMNDIEQRCDAYLGWLDAERRNRTPVLNQIAAVGAATSAIMGVSGVGTQALAIVASAFGLASATYANWNSRLLLEVEHSTVQTVVYTRQQQFRQSNAGVIVPDRVSAIYLLRGYLRICMPITIETDINTSVTLERRGAPQSVVQSPLVRPIATAPLVPRAVVVAGERPIGSEFQAGSRLLTAYDRRVDTVENLRAPLRALCATEAQIENANSNIVALQYLIRFYQFTDTYQPGDNSLSPEVTGKLTPIQIKRLRAASPCSLTENAENLYELRRLPRGLKGYIGRLNRALPSEPPLDSNANVADIRARIAQVRKTIPPEKLPFKDNAVADQITPDLASSIP
jgi:hypothetical protein